jgi:hypothetical protein
MLNGPRELVELVAAQIEIPALKATGVLRATFPVTWVTEFIRALTVVQECK